MSNSIRFASIHLVLLGLFFAWMQPVVGQSTGGHEDIIYLVNKGRYRGEIIDWDREGQVRIRTERLGGGCAERNDPADCAEAGAGCGPSFFSWPILQGSHIGVWHHRCRRILPV
ncbi:MAG: hypothetical protein IPJ06_11840 [Saprospiraceae bacterium]|nr:hypothetical protein [Saprospiraceae bacterium]